jgi:Mg-chelatase subunit ChlD
VTFQHPQVLYLLLLLPVMLIIWWWRGMRTVPSSMLLRLAAVALVVLALAHPTQGRAVLPEGPLVILVDQSDSLTTAGKAALRAEARNMVQTLRERNGPEGQQAAVLWFGDDVTNPGEWAEANPQQEPPAMLVESIDPAASDLAGALRAARDLLAATAGGTESGRIILLSDGVQTVGDALAEARLTAEAGLMVDTLPVEVVQMPELRIVQIDAPRTLHVGEEYTIQIGVRSSAPAGAQSATQGTLRLWDGEELLAEQAVNLEPGDNSFSFQQRATSTGVVRLRAAIEGTPDTFARNNSASAAALVEPSPRVLLVEGRPGGAQQFSSALWNAGVESEIIAAGAVPTRLSRLDGYDGMVLVDVPAHALSFDQMTSVKEFVRSEGRGLVVTGGTNSYGLGGYDDTPLEEVLPVNMDAPPRPDRSEVALLLIIDRSASMDTALGVSKFDMAKEAAILSTETLRQEDTIGVLAFDTETDWTVPFQRIGQGIGLEQIQDSIATLPTGGGTNIFRALTVGLGELSQQTMPVRHVVLLTDGRSFTDDRVAYQQLAESALSQGITLSTIAIGFDSDTELLDNLAQWGGGRYYFADDPEDIPRLTLQESEIARSDPSVEGVFRADLTEPHPLLRGFSPAALPQLQGYVATTSKDAAELVLQSPDADPVLAAWQYGLGRAVAWTSSTGGPWANEWVDWVEYGRFWAQVVRYTLPEQDSGPLDVRLEPQAEGVRLVVDATQESGAPLDLAANAVAQVTLPDGTDQALALRQVSPGRYVRDLRLPTSGAYGVTVVLEHDGQQFRADTGYVKPVAAEYLPQQPGDGRLQGEPLLQEVAALTGGQVREPNSTLDVPAAEEAADQETPDPLRDAWKWLLGAALLLWVLEIAVRRGLFIRDR